MTTRSRERFAEVVRAEPADVGLACLLIGCETEPDLEVDRWLSELDDLAATAKPLVRELGLEQGMRRALGSFSGSAEDYQDVRSSLLHEVLRRGRGLPVLLSVVWCEVAARIDQIALPLGHPGHVRVCLGDPLDTYVVVDPFRGGLAVEAPPEPVLQPNDLLLRILTNIRVLAQEQGRSLEAARTQLWATELSLLLPSHPLALRQERGDLMSRLGDFTGGARELEAYADLVEDTDPAAADAARRHARLAISRLN
ncbi:MAG: putative transcriptional regulator [Frankiales bacterium]|nr:putative transcriptional regulator [Frankiales bacterium]